MGGNFLTALTTTLGVVLLPCAALLYRGYPFAGVVFLRQLVSSPKIVVAFPRFARYNIAKDNSTLSVIFLFSGIMRKSILLILATLLFAPLHILISYQNAKNIRKGDVL